MSLRLSAVAACFVLFLGACGSTPAPDAGSPPPDAGPAPGDAGPRDAAIARRPDAGPIPFAPDRSCPGSPGCERTTTGMLEAGAARVDISPVVDEFITLDQNNNGTIDFGDQFNDANGDGDFDGQWLAGFGAGRAATEIADPMWARAIVLRENDTTIAFVYLDVVGYFRDEMERIRALLADLPIDYVVIGSTHTHEARDVVGLWGEAFGVSGVNVDFNRSVQAKAAMAVRQAYAALQPAHIQYATIDMRDQPGGVRRYVGDRRDPFVVDDQIRVMRFTKASDASTLATIINFGAHPEYQGSENTKLSSDFPHFLREGVENGLTIGAERRDGVGGIAVFMNGAVGSQIGPGDSGGSGAVSPATVDGMPVPNDSRERAKAVGDALAWFTLQALGPSGGSVTDETAHLGFRNRSFLLTVQNKQYHIGLGLRVFVRNAYNWDPESVIVAGRNEPQILSEVAVIDVGRSRIVTVPGELDPCLWLGGYDGSYTPPMVPVVDMTRENPPNLAEAPAPPYLRDLARTNRPSAEYFWLSGLTNDFTGYFVPEYDYELAPGGGAYISEAPGDHYEETTSVGIDGWPTVRRELTQLLAWPNP